MFCKVTIYHLHILHPEYDWQPFVVCDVLQLCHHDPPEICDFYFM